MDFGGCDGKPAASPLTRMRPSSESPALMTPRRADKWSPAEDYEKQLGSVLKVFFGGGAMLAAAMLIDSTRVPVRTLVNWLDAFDPWFESTIAVLTTH